jgi:hypothetical protein
MTTDETTLADLVRRLTYAIEDSRLTLHRDRNRLDRCKRLQLGLAFSRPEDCDCGLDALLAEARSLTGDELRLH